MSVIYEFALPVGAIVSIAGCNYVHAGNGVVYSHNDNDRPFVFDGVAHDDGPQKDVILSKLKSDPWPRYRVFHRAFTEDEAELR